MIYVYLFMCVVFFGYNSWIASKFGILGSISESYYHLPKSQQKWFVFFCEATGFSAAVLGGTVLSFLAAAGIIMVGAAAAFKERLDFKVHMIGAFGSVTFSQLFIFFDLKLYWLNAAFMGVFLFVILLTFIFKKNIKYFYWIEVAAFISILVALFPNI